MSDETIPIRRSSIAIPDFVAQQQINQTQKDELKYPTETIPLPTKGWFYPDNHPLASGEIELKQMTAKEEDILANQELLKKGKVLDRLLESLIVNKAITQEEILAPDKNAIFIAIRRLSYGDDYPVSITCPSCGGSNKVNINLSQFEFKNTDFSKHTKGQNSFTFTFPDCKKTITYKLLNQIDEMAIDAELTNLKKVSKEAIGDLTVRLKHLITSIDGNPDKAAIRKFVDTLKAKDSLALRKNFKETIPELDRTIDFKCNNCPFERRMDMPIEASFLWPDTEA
jgi:hypothetical protein